jgi:hypothetical protein
MYHQTPPAGSHGRRRAWRVLAPAIVAAVLGGAAVAVVSGVDLSAVTASAATNTSQYRGVNWADVRDNFVNGPIVPSGLALTDSYATVYAKSTAILNGFQTNLGANTVRFGMNAQTTSSAWWNSYLAAFDATLAKGMNVILAPWAYPGTSGRVTNPTEFYAMWDKVINQYGSNNHFYFEIYNEPNGYSDTDWVNFAASFLAHYPNLPRGQIVVAGTGNDANIGPVGQDSRLNGTLLSLHIYAAFGTVHTTEAGWISQLNSQLAGYGSRSIITEFGVPMTTGANYNGDRDGDNNRSYFWALTDTIRSAGLGSVYWPGLRNGDAWSMETLHGTGTDLTLTDNNSSGVDRLKYAWGGTPTTSPTTGAPSGGTTSVVRGSGSNRCLDVPNAASTNGIQLNIWDCNGGNNQAWTLTSSKQLQVYGNKCLDALGGGTAAGTKVVIWDCGSAANQQWNLNANGTVTGVQSGLCLDVVNAATGNGALIDLWTCNGGTNQQWTRS